MRFVDHPESDVCPMVVPPVDRSGAAPPSLRDWLAENRQSVLDRLDARGALLFHGWTIAGVPDFEAAAIAMFGSLLSNAGNNAPRRRRGGKVYTASEFPSTEEIPLHNELSYRQRYPLYIAFYCMRAAANGGETTLGDGRTLLRALPKDLVERFAARSVRYVRALHGGVGLGKSWQETFETSHREEVENRLTRADASFEWTEDSGLIVAETVDPIVTHPRTGEKAFFCQVSQWHPATLAPEIREALTQLLPSNRFPHMCTYGDGGEIAEEDILQIRAAEEKIAASCALQEGDFLILDNLLCLHGRRPFVGDREVLVACGPEFAP
jgi:alpha-ketoglutarate-dependent taurine dioxygenase